MHSKLLCVLPEGHAQGCWLRWLLVQWLTAHPLIPLLWHLPPQEPSILSRPAELEERIVFSLEEVQQLWRKDPSREGKFEGSQPKVKQVVTGKGTHAALYLHNTLSLFAQQDNPLVDIRDKFPDVPEATWGFLDKYRSSLVLLGGPGTGTGLHLDWTEAWNIAFAVIASDIGAVLAVWVFIHPSAVSTADQWLKEHGSAGGFATPGKVVLDDDDVAGLKAALPPGSVVILEQHAGDRVYVPPGWVHQVRNLRPSLKLAWDWHDMSHLSQYAMLQSRIASPLFGAAMAHDYMGTNWFITALLNDM